MFEDMDCIDNRVETQIATVEIIVEGEVVYSQPVFINDINDLKDDVINLLCFYDEAK